MTAPTIGTEATSSVLTLETCDKCGPNVYAAFAVTGRTGKLTFCAHCTNHGVARTLARFAMPIVSEFADLPTDLDETADVIA